VTFAVRTVLLANVRMHEPEAATRDAWPVLSTDVIKVNAVQHSISSRVRVVRQKNMVMGPAGPEPKNDCAGKGQQQFTRQTFRTCSGAS
jgi:hypothetical protein